MRIISKVNHPYCKQLVKEIFQEIGASCNEIVIEEVDGKKIYLYGDGLKFIIKLRNIHELVSDGQDQICQVSASYSLYAIVSGYYAGSNVGSVKISNGPVKIMCKE